MELLPEVFPVLDHYRMPKELFAPILDELPFLADQLETIADCESMGGCLPTHSVPVVRDFLRCHMLRGSGIPRILLLLRRNRELAFSS